MRADDWVAIPSYPGVRLWPETSDGIFSVPPESAEIAHYTDKRRVSDPALVPFAEGPSALRCLYFLNDEGDAFPPEPAILPAAATGSFHETGELRFQSGCPGQGAAGRSI